MKVLFILFFAFKQIAFFIPYTKGIHLINHNSENYKQIIVKREDGIKVNINFEKKRFPMVSKAFLKIGRVKFKRIATISDNIYYYSTSYTEFVKNVLLYLKEEIKYSEEELPQDALTVSYTKRGYCTGFSHLTSMLLKRWGVKHREVSGLYFNKEKNILQKHRWLEIFFPGYGWYSIDPINGSFSYNYIYGDIDTNIKTLKMKNIKFSFEIENF
jgi:hypothetical protein